MTKVNIKISVIALAIGLVMVSCGGGNSNKQSAATTPETQTEQAAPAKSESKIDLSKFTAVEIPKWDMVKDWMLPEFGVITKADEMVKDWMYSFTVCGVTKSDLESYKKTLEANGMKATSAYTYENETTQVSLGTAGIDRATKDSEMTISVQKKR